MRTTILTALLLMTTVVTVLAKDIQYTIRIDGISCPFCVATSEKALKEIEGVHEVQSDLKKGTITVCADDEKVSFTDESLSEMFKQKGFTYRGMEMSDQCKNMQKTHQQ